MQIRTCSLSLHSTMEKVGNYSPRHMSHHKCTANVHSSYATYLHFSYTHMGNRHTCCVLFSADIDECEEDLDKCHEWATCINTIGSYDCICNPGSTGDGVNCTGENMAMYTVYFGFVIVCACLCMFAFLFYSRSTGCV